MYTPRKLSKDSRNSLLESTCVIMFRDMIMLDERHS
jgi:hypothetical protein